MRVSCEVYQPYLVVKGDHHPAPSMAHTTAGTNGSSLEAAGYSFCWGGKGGSPYKKSNPFGKSNLARPSFRE